MGRRLSQYRESRVGSRIPLGFLLLMVGCGDGSPTDDEASAIVGTWFGCDIADCTILDDDGYEFTEAGDVYRIEEALRLPGPGCDMGGCFSADAPSVTVTRNLVGSYTFSDPSLTLTIDVCTETTQWQISGVIGVTQSQCLGDYGVDGQYRRFAGTVIVQ